MVPAIEVLLPKPIVRKLIDEREDAKLNDVMRASTEERMQDLTQSLCKPVQSDLIENDVAMSFAPNPEARQMLLQGVVVDEGRSIVGV